MGGEVGRIGDEAVRAEQAPQGIAEAGRQSGRDGAVHRRMLRPAAARVNVAACDAMGADRYCSTSIRRGRIRVMMVRCGLLGTLLLGGCQGSAMLGSEWQRRDVEMKPHEMMVVEREQRATDRGALWRYECAAAGTRVETVAVAAPEFVGVGDAPAASAGEARIAGGPAGGTGSTCLTGAGLRQSFELAFPAPTDAAGLLRRLVEGRAALPPDAKPEAGAASGDCAVQVVGAAGGSGSIRERSACFAGFTDHSLPLGPRRVAVVLYREAMMLDAGSGAPTVDRHLLLYDLDTRALLAWCVDRENGPRSYNRGWVATRLSTPAGLVASADSMTPTTACPVPAMLNREDGIG
jgi:hypothetical protein